MALKSTLVIVALLAVAAVQGPKSVDLRRPGRDRIGIADDLQTRITSGAHHTRQEHLPATAQAARHPERAPPRSR
jgi:hypothetical protein